MLHAEPCAAPSNASVMHVDVIWCFTPLGKGELCDARMHAMLVVLSNMRC